MTCRASESSLSTFLSGRKSGVSTFTATSGGIEPLFLGNSSASKVEANSKTWVVTLPECPGCDNTRLLVSYALDSDPKGVPHSSAIPCQSSQIHPSVRWSGGQQHRLSFSLIISCLSRHCVSPCSHALIAQITSQVLLGCRFRQFLPPQQYPL